MAYKPLFKVGASYDGGHPQHRHDYQGHLVLWHDRLEFTGSGMFTIPVGTIIGCELRPQQLGVMRSILLTNNRAL
jgi:hypothetical protein